jgi:transcriptional regulator with XRE-family HTH domain
LALRGAEPLTLGQRLKARRLDLNFTLRELAHDVKVDFTYLSKIENDKTDHPPSEDLLRRLAKELKDDAEELILLSGQIPKHIKDEMTKSGSAAQFFRSVKKHGMDKATEILEKHGGEKE